MSFATAADDWIPGKPRRLRGLGSLMLNVQSASPVTASKAYIVPFHDPTYTTPSTTAGEAETAAVPLPVEKNQRTFKRETVPRLICPCCGLNRLCPASKPYLGQSARAGQAAGAGAFCAVN